MIVDLTKVHVDVIVHPTDSKISFHGMVGHTLLNKGGSNLENAVRSCVQSEGCLGYLEVRRTAAYNIEKFYSISLPSVGSGKAGLPKQMAAHTTLQTLKN
ncbi:unnamed protein product [Heterobilharzia americana]|nr:unnamed protein product [Heterobilharzia americana]